MSAVDTAINREDVVKERDLMREMQAAAQCKANQFPSPALEFFEGLTAGYEISANRLDLLLGEDTRPDAERAL